jgi:hypothetical protein
MFNFIREVKKGEISNHRHDRPNRGRSALLRSVTRRIYPAASIKPSLTICLSRRYSSSVSLLSRYTAPA